jgi:hypothetical protein
MLIRRWALAGNNEARSWRALVKFLLSQNALPFFRLWYRHLGFLRWQISHISYGDLLISFR